MSIKFILVIFSVAVAATAYADIVAPEVLHRIGYEVLVAAAGAAALGGGLLRKLRNESKAADKTAHWKDVPGERSLWLFVRFSYCRAEEGGASSSVG